MVEDQSHPKPQFNRRRIIGALIGLPVFCYVFLFLPAGTVAWFKGWLFIAIFLIMETIIIVYLWRTNPELLIARSHFHTGTKRWDKILLAVMFPILLTMFPIAALDDSRFHWSAVPWWLVVFGYLSMLSGFCFATWAGRVKQIRRANRADSARPWTDSDRHRSLCAGPTPNVYRVDRYVCWHGTGTGTRLLWGAHTSGCGRWHPRAAEALGRSNASGRIGQTLPQVFYPGPI